MARLAGFVQADGNFDQWPQHGWRHLAVDVTIGQFAQHFHGLRRLLRAVLDRVELATCHFHDLLCNSY